MQNADAFSQKVPLSHCRQRKQTYTLQLHFYNKTPFKTQSLTIRLKQTQTQSTETQRKHKAKNTTETKISLECTPLPSLLSTKSKPAENTETCKKPTVVHFGVSSHQVITSFLIEQTVLPFRILLGNSPFTKPNMSPPTNHTHSPLLSFDVYINAW